MRTTVAFGLVLLFCTALTASAVDIGNYRIPSAVNYGGVAVEPGMYTIQIEEGAEGPYLQLSKDGTLVAKDLAIIIPAKGAGKTSVQIANVQEFVRVRVRHGDNWYYAYMPRQ